jgi:hypothetical protein
MAKTSITKRRAIRELEAKRDALLMSKDKHAQDLATVRAKLKVVRQQS